MDLTARRDALIRYVLRPAVAQKNVAQKHAPRTEPPENTLEAALDMNV